MDLKKIYKQLGIASDYEREWSKFANRSSALLEKIDDILTKHLTTGSVSYDNSILKRICYNIGYDKKHYDKISKLIKKDGLEKIFLHNIEVLQITIKTLEELDNGMFIQMAKEGVKDLFEKSLLDLGYSLKDGEILKTGAKELDENLVFESLDWLNKYPAIRKSYVDCLERYAQKKYPDAITNAYSSLESLVKNILNTNKSLDSVEVRAELIKKLGLEQDWGQLLFHFSKLAHEFSSRHGKKKTETIEIKEELVEFYIYFVGVFIRLISRLN